MKRVLLLSLALLLTLTLLPTVSMAAPGKNKKEPDYRTVTFNGDITGNDKLQILEWGKNFRLYTPTGENTPLIFVETTPGLWVNATNFNFTGYHEGKLGITIDKTTGKASIEYKFDTKPFEDKDWSKYKLEASGVYDEETRKITVDDETSGETSTISEMFYELAPKKKGNGAIHVTFEEVWSGLLSFTITIT